VVLLDCDDDVVLAVSDDGQGFDTAAMGTASHGLAGMRHRVEARGGQFTVSSVKGRGTLVVAVLPARAGSGSYPSH
jgi:signal transduction histidine kinase